MMDYIQIYFNLTDDQYNRLTVQQKLILDFVAAFSSITPMDAFTYLKITKLATRISEMKALGIQFDQVYESRRNGDGKCIRYMRYRKAA